MPSASYTHDNCLHHYDLPTFLQRLRQDPETRPTVVRLGLGNAGDNEPPRTDTISLCTLKELLGLLPRLECLLVYGVVLVRCDNPIHDANPDQDCHVDSPRPTNLLNLSLRRISIAPPFDVDLLHIVCLAPQLRTLTVSSCYALPGAVGSDVTDVDHTLLPPLTLPAEPVFPNYFRTLKLTFPDRAERARYRMELPWYDFTRRLSTDRGTVIMVLHNVYDACSTAIKELLDDDGTTLGTLEMNFESDFQKSSSQRWTHVPIEDCHQLRSVKFCLPVRLIMADDSPTSPVPFTTIGRLVKKTPERVSRVHLKLTMLDNDVDDKCRALEALPWATFDQHLTAHCPYTTLSINLAGDWPSHAKQAVKELIRSSMGDTVARGRVVLGPKACWKEGI